MERKARVLGVDDSLTIRKALEIVLKPAGYELELAADGAEAIAKAKSFQPDVILLDFILPDMRGSEVCQHLALDPQTAHIPVILVSAKGAEIRQAYRDATNVVSYIAKPFKPQVVTGIVAEVLAKTAAGEQVKAAVPVHEAEGLAVPPMPAAPPPAAEPLAAAPPVAEVAASTPAIPAGVSVPPVAPSEITRPTPAPRERPASRAAERATRKVPARETVQETPVLAFATDAERREALDLMFETLRASIEGVYVEEVDTPLGAAADQAKSYLDLLDALSKELAEGMRHARSGTKYRMYNDGSVRSLDGALHEIFRRTCRLLFRATSAAAVTNEPQAPRERVLVVCHKGGTMWRQLPALLAAHPEWQAFTISEGFRQLPMMVRLLAPSLVLTEIAPSGALWDQLRVAAQLPEWRDAEVVGILASDRPLPAHWTGEDSQQAAIAERGIARVLQSLFDWEGEQSAPATGEASTSTELPVASNSPAAEGTTESFTTSTMFGN